MTVAHERKERSAKARLGYLWFSSFLWLKITLSSDVKGWWCCEYHPACDGKRFSLCPKGALTGFVSFPLQVCSTAASPASRVCLWLLHFLFWTLWSVLSWRRNKFNCPARAEMESRFAVYQTLHQLLQRQALRTSVRRRRRESRWKSWAGLLLVESGKGTSHRGVFAFGFYFSWVTVSESWILCTVPTRQIWGLQVPFLSVITLCSFYSFVFNTPFLCKIHYSGFCA